MLVTGSRKAFINYNKKMLIRLFKILEYYTYYYRTLNKVFLHKSSINNKNKQK